MQCCCNVFIVLSPESETRSLLKHFRSVFPEHWVWFWRSCGIGWSHVHTHTHAHTHTHISTCARALIHIFTHTRIHTHLYISHVPRHTPPTPPSFPLFPFYQLTVLGGILFSRAHTIVAITFVQKTPNESGKSMTKTSVINLVDLAGR